MIGNFKILGIIIFLLMCNCKKKNVIVESKRQLITQNINILIDSIEYFDISKMPAASVSTEDFKKYKPIKMQQIQVALLDSILVEDKLNDKGLYVRFNLSKEELVNFKSNYKIELVKVNDYNNNILFVSFFNFKIQGNKSTIDVKKVIGISMVHHRYYFEKENDNWVFKIKCLVGLG